MQRYDKKCTYASKRVIILQKDRLIYLIYPSAAIGSLLTDGCRWEYDRVLTIFENNYESLEYGQHFANVLSRWAREYTNEVGALEVLQKYIPSPSPYPFFGGNPPRRGRGVPKKCTSSRCPRSTTKYVAERGGNPPHRGRGVPKKCTHPRPKVLQVA